MTSRTASGTKLLDGLEGAPL